MDAVGDEKTAEEGKEWWKLSDEETFEERCGCWAWGVDRVGEQ